VSKAPAFQFYIKDWLSDPQLKMAEWSTKGIWIDMLCYMWSAPVRGELQGAKSKMIKMIGANEADFNQFLEDAKQLSFCDISVTDNENITVRNRRMYLEEKDKKNNKERQQRHRDKQKSNGKITPLSPTASPSPTAKKEKTIAQNALKGFEKFWSIYPKKRSKGDAEKAWKKIKPNEQLLAIIIATIERAKTSDDWVKDNGQYIPYPATWLNGKGWDDDYQANKGGKELW
jgi:hypothetical protein